MNSNRIDDNMQMTNSVFPENYRFGAAYVPRQRLNEVFEPEVALKHGTLFPELVDPYYPNQSHAIMEFLRSGERS